MQDKEIDKMFSRKLKELERTPRPQAFDRLSAQLARPKRKVIPVWWTATGVGLAASVLLLLVFTNRSAEKTSPAQVALHPVPRAATAEILKQESAPQVEAIEKAAMTSLQQKTAQVAEKNIPQQPHKIIPATKNQHQETAAVYEKENEVAQAIPTTLPLKTIAVENKPLLGAVPVLVIETAEPETLPAERKKTKIGRILKQLKNFKQGEKVDLKELGIDKQAIVATLKDKFN